MTVADHTATRSGDGEQPAGGRPVLARSPTAIALARLRRDRVAVVAGAVVFVLAAAAVFAPAICDAWGISTAPDHPGTNIDPATALPAYGPPLHGFTWAHPLGISPKDASDNLAQLLYGLRTDLAIAAVATAATTALGTFVGLVAGFSRGFLERLISFVVDTFLSFPFILGALCLAPIVTGRFADDPGRLVWAQAVSLVVVLIVFGRMGLARLIRGYVISLREREFVLAAQTIGMSTRRILVKELLPNLLPPITVSISITLPAYVAISAGLSFLGLGITGSPSLGQTIATATPYYASYPLYLYAPVAVLTGLVLALNLLGDAVRDTFDPQTRH